MLAVGLCIGACVAWSYRVAPFGDRPLESHRVLAAWAGCAGLLLTSQAVIVGVVIPSLYRSRAVYLRSAVCLAGFGVLAGVASVGLFLAAR